MFRLRTLTTLTAALGIALSACSSDGNSHPAAPVSKKDEQQDTTAVTRTVIPVDYSMGRAMNKRLGKGINLGNSWDSPGRNDEDVWHNPIYTTDFPFIKNAGFNSVRIPVRWQSYSDYETHTVDQERLEGVKEHVKLALEQGLAVIVNFHHYVELNNAGNKYTTDPAAYEAEKAHFLSLWAQVASEFNTEEFPDSMVVLEILNEPTIGNAELVDNLMNEAYQVIRAHAPGKTIMFESYHAAKFADLNILHLPADGNIIYSGHYYEPYNYSHQGHSYACNGDAAYANTAASDLLNYAKQAKALYPDVNGVDAIPLNMGEFGISGGSDYAERRNCKSDSDPLPSAKMKAYWAKATILAAEENGMSWNYWGFVGVGGFEAAYRDLSKKVYWYEGFPAAFGF